MTSARQALLAIRELQAELDRLRSSANEPIAIIGMGCRYPGANGLKAFWRLLAEGRDAVCEVPPDRWDAAALYSPDPISPGKMVGRKGGFLKGIDEFDAAFFGITPREAPHVDPRQRIILEAAWEALEEAGIVPSTLAGSRTGVFISTLTNDYDHLLFSDLCRADAYSGAGAANSIVANRISYFLDLHGPSLALDTACSGSLVAIHLACESLRRGESSLALAGGVNINLMPKSNVFFSKAGALSPEGRCKTFDAAADGMVRSDGAGVLVLKPLAAALKDGDAIAAVIRASAVNHDGRSNGIMAPNGEAQRTVLAEAYQRAGISPGLVQYVEAHGTGTRLGDPIEVEALGAALSHGRPPERKCLLGSVKTNVGHTEAAAGVAGVIKTALALQKRRIPPSLHFENPNPLIPFDRLPFEVPKKQREWPHPSEKLIAGVSAFGFGGTNAHVVLEEAPPQQFSAPAAPPYALPLSARTPGAASQLVAAYGELLADEAADAANICYTAAVRRTHHGCRIAVSGGSREELRAKLAERAAVLPEASREPRTVFVFSGQGSHWPGMGCELYSSEPVFRGAMDECDRLLAAHSGWHLLEEIEKTGAASRLNDTTLAQPAIFALQIALAALWRSWGITPALAIGHSLGEAAAAYVAGALSLEDAVRVVFHRSRLMKNVEGKGKTAVVGLPLDRARAAIAGLESQLAVAGSNGPATSVLSGDPAALDSVLTLLGAQGIFCRTIPGVEIAFHSPQMDVLLPELAASLSGIEPRRSTVPLISTVTGQAIDGELLNAHYWTRNLREPFLFAQALGGVLAGDYAAVLEVSPHAVLASSIVQTARHAGSAIATFTSLKRAEPERAALLGTLCKLYEIGHSVEWSALHPAGGRVAALPHYPWQRQRYWFDMIPGSGAETESTTSSGAHPLLGRHFELPQAAGRIYAWETRLDARHPAWLADHRLLGSVVLPGAASVEMALAGARQIWPDREIAVRDLMFEVALRLDEACTVQAVFAVNGEAADFSLYSRPAASRGGEWTRHAAARVTAEKKEERETERFTTPADAEPVSVESHYEAMRNQGLEYGPAFRGIAELWRGESEAFANLALSPELRDERYSLHPALLDTSLQTVAAAVKSRDAYLPANIGEWRVYRPAAERIFCHARLRGKPGAETLEADITLYDERGRVARMTSLALRRIGAGRNLLDGSLLEWQWQPRPLGPANSTHRSHWLIVGSAGGFASALAAELMRRGHKAVLAATAEDAIRALELARVPFDGAVHLTALDIGEATPFDEAETLGCGSALRLTQALAGLAPSTRLWLVTRGAQPVDRSPLQILQSPLHGLALVIGREHPELQCVSVDLDAADPAANLQPLLDEMLSPDDEVRTAWRNGARLAARVARAKGPQPGAAVIDPEGAYLITGGLGSLGLATAKALVEAGARHLLLTSRSGASGKQEVVDELIRLGASVRVVAADISDAADAQRLFGELRRGALPLRGVIHSAGILDDGLIADQTPERFRRVMEPKVQGAWNLHLHTKGLALDFFVLYSSAASLVGSAGQSNYASANAFLDALAHYRRAAGLPGLSINWGAWETGGMATLHTRERMAARGVSAISLRDGLDLLLRFLQPAAPAQIGVFPVDWSKFLAQFPDAVPSIFEAFQTAAPLGRQKPFAERVCEMPMSARQEELRQFLHGELAAVLGFDCGVQVAARQRFFDLGMDSLMALEFRTRLETNLAMKLPATLAFDYPSLEALSRHLRETLPAFAVETSSAESLSSLAGHVSGLDALGEDDLAELLARELEGEVHAG